MTQSIKHSAIEVVTNTSIGMAGSWAITYVAISAIPDRPTAAAVTVAACTVWSLLRGFAVRRAFNKVGKS